MLALCGRSLRDRPIWLEGACDRGRGRKPAGIAAGGEGKSCAQQGGHSPKAAAHPGLAPSHTLCHSNCSYLSRELIPAKHFNLPHPEHFDSRPAARLNPAADTNPSIFEGLKYTPSSLERREHAP